jgi:uncharacterized DUF497 family protein
MKKQKLLNKFAANWETETLSEGGWHHYDGQRFQVTGYIGDRLFVMICSFPDDETAHIISLRYATAQERRNYANA